MLPSMPVLFSRESQDAFGNKIEPSTSFFNQNTYIKPAIQPEPPPPTIVIEEPAKPTPKDTKPKANVKKKEEPPKFDNNALETALVKSYYSKVQSRFSSNSSGSDKFVQFQNILKTFDPSKETPVELYKQIEQLFGEEHADILEDFLLFLKPGQAARVGRFMDHFVLVQLTSFIELLHTTFNRKPTVLRKILRAITTGINSGSSEVMKTRVLPHLRSNLRLSQMFKSLFPDERPPDSVYEAGVDKIPDEFLTENKGYETWDFMDEEEEKAKKLVATQSLDTMYLHGRIFLQHGRLLRSAHVNFPYSKEPYRAQVRRVAPSHCDLTPSQSEDETASPKRKINSKVPPKKAKKQIKSPTKNVKDVNGNTKVKDVASALSSPKAVKGKTQNKKSKKDDKETQKRERKDSKNACQKKDDSSKAKQPKIETCTEAKTQKITEPVCTVLKADVKTNNWTRDEDKTMLEVLKGETNTEQVFGRVQELLPHRSVADIKARFCHVMTLLQQMATATEVT